MADRKRDEKKPAVAAPIVSSRNDSVAPSRLFHLTERQHAKKASATVIIQKMAGSDQELLPGTDEFSGAMRR
jgi:hypothetical protein